MAIVVSHGGSSSNPDNSDGPELACQAGLRAISEGRGALQAVVAATILLEDDPRFNAGTGSNLRLDGITIQMDASCMTSDGAFSAIAAIERVKNPILVAEGLRDTPHILLAGEGATEFARKLGHPDYDPTTQVARERFAQGQNCGRPNRRMVESGAGASLELRNATPRGAWQRHGRQCGVGWSGYLRRP